MTDSPRQRAGWLLRWGASTAVIWGWGWLYVFPWVVISAFYGAGLLGLAAGAGTTELAGPHPARGLALTLGILTAYPLAAAAVGALTGAAQWLALRGDLPRPLLWILFSGWAEAETVSSPPCPMPPNWILPTGNTIASTWRSSSMPLRTSSAQQSWWDTVGLGSSFRRCGRHWVELKPIPLAVYEEPIPVFEGWPDAPCGYLRFTQFYEGSTLHARREGWPYAELEGGHFHMLADPRAVADALLDLATEMEVGRAPR